VPDVALASGAAVRLRVRLRFYQYIEKVARCCEARDDQRIKKHILILLLIVDRHGGGRLVLAALHGFDSVFSVFRVLGADPVDGANRRTLLTHAREPPGSLQPL